MSNRFVWPIKAYCRGFAINPHFLRGIIATYITLDYVVYFFLWNLPKICGNSANNLDDRTKLIIIDFLFLKLICMAT